MRSPLRWLRRRALALDPASALAQLDEFVGADAPVRPTFEAIVRALVDGYGAALEEHDPAALAQRLELHAGRWRGFAYEGAGMGLWLVDATSLGRARRWREFVEAHGEHVYLLHVGAGWGVARLHRDWVRATRRLDPLLRWLALDGRGFHDGFFSAQRFHVRRESPRGLDARERAVFDQGLGRSLWFVAAAEPERIARALEGFDAHRRSDLWSGVGLACAYAGGIELARLECLLDACGVHAAHFAQGVAFAAEARERARTPDEWTTAVCRRVWQCEPERVTATVRRTSAAARRDGSDAAYVVWRAEIRRAFELREVEHAGAS